MISKYWDFSSYNYDYISFFNGNSLWHLDNPDPVETKTISIPNAKKFLISGRIGVQYSDPVHHWLTLECPATWKKTPSTWKKFPIMNFSNISLVHNKILCILVFCNAVLFSVCSTFSYFLCAHSTLFGMKYTFYLFIFFVFFCFALFSSVPH